MTPAAPQLIYYKARAVTAVDRNDLPGMSAFCSFFKIYSSGVAPVDRTGTIRTPIRVTSLFPLPEMRPLSDTYEDVCNERAAELLARADALKEPLYLFYSGGIDSSLALISLLKHATPEQARNIIILLSEESITENPTLYRDHIYGKMRVMPAGMFSNILGGPGLIVNGEHNDQIFGSDMIGKFMVKQGPHLIHQPYSRDVFFDFFNPLTGNPEATNVHLDAFERLKDAAPIPIRTNYDYLWWINFALKWQTVNTRVLSFVSPRNRAKITHEYVSSRFAPFYCTEKFQLWSMNNMDKKMKDEWRTYKWPAKDIIFDFTKDAEYRDNKLKRGSLFFLVQRQESYEYIDEHMTMHNDLPAEKWFDPDNDFARCEEPAHDRILAG